MSRGRNQRDQKGAALLVVLVLVATLAAIALAISQFADRTVRRVTAAQTRDQAYWAMIGVERAALELLDAQNRLREGVDLPTERWLAEPFIIPFEGGTISARFIDRSACFNVNDFVSTDEGDGYVADPDAIKRFGTLVADLGGTANGGESLAMAAADFMDTDGNAQSGGAEDYAYSGRKVPYRTPGRPVAAVSELRAVEGWTGQVMGVLTPWLCARREMTEPGRINLNTLTEEDAPILANALGGALPLGEAERLISQRPPDGYESVGAFLGQPVFQNFDSERREEIEPRLGTEASFIELKATVSYDGMVFVLTTGIEKASGGRYRVTSRRFGPQD